MMNGMALRVGCVAIVAGLALGIGCSDPQSDLPTTHSVTGKVTLDGEPVEGAMVTFVPKGSGDSAVGVTEAGGTYNLSTFASGDGAVAGEYDVKIVKFEGSESTVEAEDEEEGGAFIPTDPHDTGDQANLLPKKYATPGASGLTATVSEEPNTFDFPLEK